MYSVIAKDFKRNIYPSNRRVRMQEEKNKNKLLNYV